MAGRCGREDAAVALDSTRIRFGACRAMKSRSKPIGVARGDSHLGTWPTTSPLRRISTRRVGYERWSRPQARLAVLSPICFRPVTAPTWSRRRITRRSRGRRAAVVNVPQSVIDDSPGAKFNNGTRFGSGKAFGSSYCQSDPPGAVGVEQLDKANVAGTMLHDTWLRQGDGRQYRVRKSAENQKVYDFIPVDHGHYIGTSWTSAQLNADRDVTLPAPVAPVTPTDVKPFTDRLRQFKQEDAEYIVSQIPAEWLDEADRKALAAYLTDRAKLAADAVAAKYPTEEKK